MNDRTNALAHRKTRRNTPVVFASCVLLTASLGSFLTLELKEPAKMTTLALVLSLVYGVSNSSILILFGLKMAREQDEYQRKLLLEALLWGTVSTLVVSFIWGSLETFTNLHHMPSIFNFGIFIVVFAIARLTLQRRSLAGVDE